jgi:hypothetical protein
MKDWEESYGQMTSEERDISMKEKNINPFE